MGIEDYVSKMSAEELSKQISRGIPKDIPAIVPDSKALINQISKMGMVDPRDIDNKTDPNPVLTGGLKEINLKRLPPIECPKFLLMHPVLDKGIKKNANKILKFGFTITPKSEDDIAKEAAQYCQQVLENSDINSTVFLSKMIYGAWGFGTSYALIQTNQRGTEAVKFEHQSEIFFGPARWTEKDPEIRKNKKMVGRIKIDPRIKKIMKYTQLTKEHPRDTPGGPYAHNENKSGSTFIDTRRDPRLKNLDGTPSLVPVGSEIESDRVVQLIFDSIGDEQVGIPLLQWIHLQIKYLLNMEHAGAQSQINFGFNKWVAKTPYKTVGKMREFGGSLANIHKEAVVVLPKDIDLTNIIPGTTEFDRIHPIYLTLISIRLGIPKPILIMDGTSTNKATLDEQSAEQMDDIFNYQIVVEGMVQEAFFKALKIKYGKDKRFRNPKDLEKIVPVFRFNESPEDVDKVMDRIRLESLTIRNYGITLDMIKDIMAETQDENLKKKYLEVANKILTRVDKVLSFNYMDKPQRMPNILAENPLGTTPLLPGNGKPAKKMKKNENAE